MENLPDVQHTEISGGRRGRVTKTGACRPSRFASSLLHIKKDVIHPFFPCPHGEATPLFLTPGRLSRAWPRQDLGSYWRASVCLECLVFDTMLQRTSLYTRHHAHPKAFLVFRGHSLKRRPKITSSPSVISGNFLILLGSEFPLIKRGTLFPTSPLRLLGTPPQRLSVEAFDRTDPISFRTFSGV